MKFSELKDNLNSPILKVVDNDLVVDTSLSINDPRVETNNTRLATLLKYKFGVDPEAFVSFIQNNNAMLAGGSLLWTIHPWCHYTNFDGDIDIYIKEVPELSRRAFNDLHVPQSERNRGGFNSLYSQFCYDHPSRTRVLNRLEEFFNLFGYHRYSCTVRGYDQDTTTFQHINYIYTFSDGIEENPRKIQVMFIDIEPEEYIKLFDIDLLRFGWNGKNLIMSENIYMKKSFSISLFNIHPRLAQSGNVKPNTPLRVVKYTSRGFIPEHINDPKFVTYAIWDREFKAAEVLIKNGFPVSKIGLKNLNDCFSEIPFDNPFWIQFLKTQDLTNFPKLHRKILQTHYEVQLGIASYLLSEFSLENKISSDILKYIIRPYIVSE
jgi:hypothetical protein